MSGLIDTHAHLHDRGFQQDRAAVLARARAAGLAAVVTVGTDLAESEAALALADQEADVFATVGVHPHDARLWDNATEARLRELAGQAKVVAIGEIGLDFYRDLSPRADQERAFRAQLELANELRLPVAIHSREAADATAAILAEWAPDASCGRPLGVLHCFDGDVALAGRYVELGFLISIAGPVTYPKSTRTREVALAIPAEVLVLETDAPYLTPQFRRGKRNEPAYVVETARFVADLRRTDAETLAASCGRNARRLFRLPVGNEVAA